MHMAVRGQRSVSSLVARNVMVGERRTSVRLEPAMWDALREIGEREGKTLNELVTEIDRHRRASSLTAAIRVFALIWFRDRQPPV